jgi:hypothetical protein
MSTVLVVVNVIIESTIKPRPWAHQLVDGRWSFTERVLASSPMEAVDQLTQRVIKGYAPRSLELVAAYTSPYPGPEVWTPLQAGPRVRM